jgi:hypothetical protein
MYTDYAISEQGNHGKLKYAIKAVALFAGGTA